MRSPWIEDVEAVKLAKVSVVILTLATIALTPILVVAQEYTDDGLIVKYYSDEELSAMREEAAQNVFIPEGPTSCFDYYDFGSVSVVPEVELTSTVPGATVAVHTSIRNTNGHPIVDGMVYAKVFNIRNGDEDVKFGNDLVDQFVALSDITLASGEARGYTFEWKVPDNADAGEYQIATYFISAKRFNLEGLSFTDDIIGGAVNFGVVSEEDGYVRFGRDSVTLNGETHEFATFMSTFDENTSEVVVEATVNNTTSSAYHGLINWTLYGWDGMRAETLVDKTTTTVDVSAKGTAKVKYTAKEGDKQYPVYYLVGELPNGASKSIIDVRYVHVQADTPWARFNDVGVSTYPLQEGSVAYACFQGFSGSSEVFPNGKVEVEVRAPGFFGSKVLGRGSYEGSIYQEFVALPVNISSAANEFTVSAKLFVNDKLVDTVNMAYTCRDLTRDECKTSSGVFSTLVTIIALLLFILILIAYRRFSKGKKDIGQDDIAPPQAGNFNDNQGSSV